MTDHWVAALLAPLAFWVLLNGIDDLVIDIAGLVQLHPSQAFQQIPTSALRPKTSSTPPRPA